jgi:hypothetical protein
MTPYSLIKFTNILEEYAASSCGLRSKPSKPAALLVASLPACLAYCLTPEMKAEYSFKTLLNF